MVRREADNAPRPTGRSARAAWALPLLLLLLLGCTESGTPILLTVRIGQGLEIDQLALAAHHATRDFPRVSRPEAPASAPLLDPQSLLVHFPEGISPPEVQLTVEGLQGGAVRATRAITVDLRGETPIAAEVWLGEHLPLPCTPGAFLACQAEALIRCNTAGDGFTSEDCAPLGCNALAARCNACTPGAAARCEGSELISCSPEGQVQRTPCPLGCAAGICCSNGDGDAISTCAGDCDDQDPHVFPGQTEFFAVPSSGTKTFDYDCDKNLEREHDVLAACQRQGGFCEGHGWQGAVPDCGAGGTFVTCQPTGRNSCVAEGVALVQRCR